MKMAATTFSPEQRKKILRVLFRSILLDLVRASRLPVLSESETRLLRVVISPDGYRGRSFRWGQLRRPITTALIKSKSKCSADGLSTPSNDTLKRT
jgi:hypothetical protein